MKSGISATGAGDPPPIAHKQMGQPRYECRPSYVDPSGEGEDGPEIGVNLS